MVAHPMPSDRACHGLRDDENTCHVRVVEAGDLAGRSPLPRLDLANKRDGGRKRRTC